MAIRWTTLKNRALRLLDDTERSRPNYTDEELLDYVNAGLNSLASGHTAQECEYVITPSQPLAELTLPENYISMGPAYYLSNGRRIMLTPVRLFPGESLPALINQRFLAQQFMISRNIAYYEYPAGRLNFAEDVLENTELHVSYFGYFDLVTDDTDLIPAPRWAEEALVWYIQMLAMAKPSVQASMLGQYKTKIDSGSPEDNPLMKSVEHCRKMWDRILASNPRQERTGWEAH